jgi:predicted DNA binding CopG/RHH family protein
MRKEYNFSKATKTPYTKAVKKQITIRLEVEIVEYFQKLAEQTGIPYQNLMNMYLHDCVQSQRKPIFKWA